jgi:hypothetical protein
MNDIERKELLDSLWGWRYTIDKETGVCLKVKEPSLVNRFGDISLSTMTKEKCKRFYAYLVDELGPDGMEGLYFNGTHYTKERK